MLFYTNFKIIKKSSCTETKQPVNKEKSGPGQIIINIKLKRKKKLNKKYLRGEMPAGVFWFIFRPTISGPRDASIQ